MHLKTVVHTARLMRHFRNGFSLALHIHARRRVEELVLWDGTRIAHPPGREGLLETMHEIWLQHVYTEGFYRPGNGDVIVDAGANIGLFAIYMARQNRRCRVIALEPFAENFEFLEANRARARCDNVRCCAMALGGNYGEAQMEAVGTRSLDHMLRGPESSGLPDAMSQPRTRTMQPKSEAGNVPVIPLSGLFELTVSEEIDFLKVDIEGSERDVFAAATPDLLRRIRRVALEYHDHLVPGTLELVRTALAPTHEVTIRPSLQMGCGILLARRRDLKH